NSLADDMGGPALTADGGTFTSARYVFGNNQGLRLSGGLADTTTYSIALSAQLNFGSSFYKKIVDFQERTNDYGQYVSGTQLQLSPGRGGSGTITNGQDFQFVLTRDGTTGETDVYLDGVLQQSYFGTPSDAAVPTTNVLTFFEDDLVTKGLE